jgi:hypothetical protein
MLKNHEVLHEVDKKTPYMGRNTMKGAYGLTDPERLLVDQIFIITQIHEDIVD